MTDVAAAFPQLEVIEFIGQGGMGVVYKARQKSLNRLVALKLLAPERVTDPQFAERFAREARALAALSHPHIVTIHDFGVARADGLQPPPLGLPESAPAKPPPTFYFLLMEFVDGVNLRQAMKAGRFTPEQALAIVPPVCEALQYAHDHGIVHRDIKPENLLLDKTGRVKIADFGIAKMLGTDGAWPRSETQPQRAGAPAPAAAGPADTAALQHTAAGTPGYMAPEQRDSSQRADSRADIYSLGVVLYELLTGELPADKLQPPSRKVQIDVRLDEIVLRALEAKPELRYQTAGEFRTQVETLASPSRGRLEDAETVLAPATLLKTGNAYLSTPEWLSGALGRFWVYSGKGTLVLARDQLSFTDAKTGAAITVPLAAILDVSLGTYPWLSKPVPLHYISVTWMEGGLMRRHYFTPNRGWFQPVWDTNPVVREWHEALRAAVTAATGKAPTETPAPSHRPALGDLVWTILPFGLTMGLISIVLFKLGQPVAPAKPPSPTTEFILSLLGLGLVVSFLTLYLLPRWGRTPGGSQPPQAPRKPSLWPTLALAAFGAPLLVHLMVRLTGQVPAEPTHPVGRLVFSFPGTLILAALAGTGLWLRHRRAAPATETTPGAVASPKLAWVVVPVLIGAALLLLLMRLVRHYKSGPGFILGLPELLILAVLGGLGLFRWSQRSAASPEAPASSPASTAIRWLGAGLLMGGMALGASQFFEESRAHNAHWNSLAREIPKSQQQWSAAQTEAFHARTALGRFEVNAVNARTDEERQRNETEHRRLTNEVAQAVARGTAAQRQIHAASEAINQMRFPSLATLRVLWPAGLMSLVGLFLLFRRGARRAGGAEAVRSSSFKNAALLMPVLLLGFLFPQFFATTQFPFRSGSPAVTITNAQHTVMGMSNHVLFTELDFRVEGTEPVELRLEFTGPALPAAVTDALSRETGDRGRLFASLRTREHNALLLQPEPSAASQPRILFQPGAHKWQIGFALPTDKATWQARGNFRPPVTRLAPTVDREQFWPLFEVVSDHLPPTLSTYRARLVAKRVPITETSRNAGVTQSSFTTVGVSNHVVIVDVNAEVGRGNAELRPVFEGPPLSREADAALADTFFPPFNGDFIKPTPHAGNQPFRILKEGQHCRRLGFVLPDAALAQAAAANLQPFGPLHAVDGRTFSGPLFEVRQTNGQVYRASLNVGPLITAADPDWVSVSTSSQHNESAARFTWEILASQPGVAKFRREGSSGSGSLQRDPNSKFHRITASLELTRVSTNRVRLVMKQGYATTTEEFPGNFRELADELLRGQNFTAKTTRGTLIELCRVQGKSLTVTVDAAPPPPAAKRASASGKSSLNTPVNMPSYFRLGLMAAGVIVIGCGGVALLVWLLRKGGASNRVVLLVLAVPFVLLALAVGALIVVKSLSHDFGPGFGLARLAKASQMVLESNYQTSVQPFRSGTVLGTQNGFILQLPAAQLASFEFFIRQADDSWQPIPALTALVATGTNATYRAALHWKLERGDRTDRLLATNQLWFWSVHADAGPGSALPQLTDHGTNFTHTLAPGEILNWWQLATPPQTVLKPGEQQIIPLFRTHGTATVSGKHPKEAFLRVRCEPLPAGLNVQGGQQLTEAGLAAHRLLTQALPATNATAAIAIPAHIEVKVLRGEKPPGAGTNSAKMSRLGFPLGTFLTIEGVRSEHGKGHARTLLVDKVGNQTLNPPVGIWMENVELPEAVRCVFKGYESGRWIGTPPEVLAATGAPVPQAEWQFHTCFLATSVEQPATLKVQAATIPAHIQFKVLRVENPPGTRNILLHFERDSNYGLAIEVWQDVTRLQGRPGPAPDQRDWRHKEWVGVNDPRVLRWVLPQEFTPDEAKALAKEMERKWKGSHPLPDGAVPEFATALHRDGWKFHLVTKVLREPGSPRPPAPAGAMFTAEQRFLVPGDALVGVRLDQSSKDGPKTELGERLVFKTAANRATGFILRWHAYPAQQGKFGNRWMLDWVDPDTGVIFHRVENSFIKPVKLTSPVLPPLRNFGEVTRLDETKMSAAFQLLRAEVQSTLGAVLTEWWDVFAEVEIVSPGNGQATPEFQLAPKP